MQEIDRMQLAINGRFFSQPVTGVQRYARELLKSLDREILNRDHPAPVEVLVPPNAQDLPEYASLSIRRVGFTTGQLWEQLELPMYCAGKLLFTPCGGAPIAHAHHVITIHDCAVFAAPEAYSRLYRTWYCWLHRRLAQRAKHVLTDSEFSRSELEKWCNVRPDRVRVVYLGSEHLSDVPADTSVLTKHTLRPLSYVLGVSSLNPSKNLQGLIDAFQLLGRKTYRLVLAGSRNSRIFSGSPELDSGILYLGRVNDAELRALYENAACFVFPSFYEGFGLPPLEALSLGCPVVAARAASLPEIGGPAFSYCDPCDPEDIAFQIGAVLDNASRRDSLLSSERKDLFNWDKCARETWEVLASCLSKE